MRIIDTSTRRPVTVFMFTLALLVFGMVLLNKLGVSLLPDLSYPTLTIRTDYEGAAPIEVENLITKPIEETMARIAMLNPIRGSLLKNSFEFIFLFWILYFNNPLK